MSSKLKIHFIGLCEICATAVQRLIQENERDSKTAPSALAIGKHLLGSERAVYKEFEPVIDGIAGALRDDCADWPKTEAKKPDPEPAQKKPDTKPDTEPKKPEPESETKKAEPAKPEPKPAPKPQPKPQPKPEPKPEPKKQADSKPVQRKSKDKFRAAAPPPSKPATQTKKKK